MDLQRLIPAVFLGAVGVAPAAQSTVTYYREIAPILFQNCAPCHRPGQSGPFPLLTYDDARRRANLIATVTRRRYMPPWLPEPGYGAFIGERRLSDAQIRSIEAWARAGAPEGLASDGRHESAAPPPPVLTQDWLLGAPDLVVRAAKPFALPGDGPDVFWNFVISPSIPDTRYVKAIEIRPGNARVHHSNLLVDRARSTRRQEAVAGEGFPGMDLTIETDTFDPDSHFLFWKPGGTPWVEPEGMAWRLDPGSDLVLNVHLQPSGKPEAVQPSVGLYFTDKPPSKRPMLVKLENDRALDIPPESRDFVVSDDFQLPLDVDVLAVYPHAHYLGKLLEAYATLPGGSRRWLIRIPQWDVNWQAVYRYRTPLFLPKGTVVSMRFHYDNSAGNARNPNSPPKRVVGGNQATDEMGHFWLQVLVQENVRGDGDQRPVLQEALMRHRIARYPDDVSAHLNLGTLLLSRKQSAAAIAHLRAALRLAPEQAQALNNYGAALQSENRIEDALEQFRHALRIQPEYPNARYNLANALLAQGKLAEAAESFRLVLAAVPGDRAASEQLRAALIGMGGAAVTAGRLSTAADIYRELVGLEPGNADLRNNFGIILAQMGDLTGALSQFEAALKANPSHLAAQRNLEQVRARLSKR
jgi:Tfp pilus assembly protein PilF/mono/diheme cytochrome c family protein